MARYRPILRMHDLQYYPTQSQRLKAQAKQDEAIGQYTTYSKIWAPANHQELLMVKAPRSVTRLSEEVYFVLMQQRVNWMIQQWLEDVNDNLEQTQELLISFCQQLGSSGDYPMMDFEVDLEADYGLMQWREAWSELLITGSEQLSSLMAHQEIGFPVEPMSKNHPAYSELLDRHQDLYLEAWLTYLVG
jgi:hypothetical protein